MRSPWLKLKYIKHEIYGWGENKKMAKKLTMILVAVMLIVGFGIGLVASPFIVATNNSWH